MRTRFVCMGLAVALVGSSTAITRRHDVSDQQLTSLGSTSFRAVGMLQYSNDPSDKRSAVLIGDKFILTAGHNLPGTGHSATVRFDGQTYETVSWSRHPLYNGANLMQGHDVAVARLNRRVIGVAPLALFTGANEGGMDCWLAGFGGTGSGHTGVVSYPWTLRAGTNRIERDPAFPNVLLADMDSGSAAHNSLFPIGSTPLMTPLESCVAPGDSGGLLAVFQDNQYKVAGIISSRSAVDGLEDSDYADISIMSRTGGLSSWIMDKAHENGRVAGHVTLNDWLAEPQGIFVSFEFRNPGSTTAIESGNADLAVDGGFSFVTGRRGVYDLTVKAPHWLRAKWSSINFTNNGPIDLAITLINGDVDEDNEIGPGDFGLLSAAFGSTFGDSNWNWMADLDGDGEVGPSDFAILSTNFGESGAS